MGSVGGGLIYVNCKQSVLAVLGGLIYISCKQFVWAVLGGGVNIHQL